MCLHLEGSSVVRSGDDRGRTYRCPSSGRGEYRKRDPLASGTTLEMLWRSSPNTGSIRHGGLGQVTEEFESARRSGGPGRALAQLPQFSRPDAVFSTT